MLEQSLRDHPESDKPISVLLIGLKDILSNGAAASREIEQAALRQFAGQLSDYLPKDALIGHCTGGEFAVYLDGELGMASASIDLGNKILSSLDAPQEILGETVQLSASAGVSSAPARSVRAEAIIIEAQMAMRIARKINSGCCIYGPDLIERDLRLNFAE